MAIFFQTLFITFGMAFVGRLSMQKYNFKKLMEFDIQRPNIVFVILITTVLILVSGLRSNIGDTIYYKHIYTITEFTLSDLDFTSDFGFDILQFFLQRITPNPQILLMVTALFTNAFIIKTMYKYSGLFEMGLFYYITMGIYLVTMNGVRQYLAASIIFLGTKYLLNRDWKKYVLIVLVACTFHVTAVVMLPTYFFATKKAWSKYTLLILGLGVILVVFYQYLYSFIYAAGGERFSSYEGFDEGGANIIRLLVFIAPSIIAFFGRKRLPELTPYSDIIVNMCILGIFFMIISLQNWIFARMAIYFNLYQMLLVSWLVNLFVKKDRKLIYLILLVCYFLYFYYEQVIILNINYRSDLLGIG